MKNIFKILCLIFLVSGCAYTHHVQVGEIVQHPNYQLIPFELLISETGFNLQELGRVGKAVIRDKSAGSDFQTIAAIIGLFQMGPRTGNPVWSSDDYADKMYYALYEKCPSGAVTGLTSIRETNKYPVVSGEIIKVRGYCLRMKTQPKRKSI